MSYPRRATCRGRRRTHLLLIVVVAIHPTSVESSLYVHMRGLRRGLAESPVDAIFWSLIFLSN
jgi:hypothetical protein